MGPPSLIIRIDKASNEPVKEQKPKTRIYFARFVLPLMHSRTQKQIQQVIKELKSNTPYRPKISILGSKEFYCIHPSAKKAININDNCDQLLEEDNCVYYGGAKKLTRFADQLFDIEDLAKMGKKHSGCPYYAARILAVDADIVFMPYNYLIDPLIRESCYLPLKDNIVILDEAHNIEGLTRFVLKVRLLCQFGFNRRINYSN